MQMYGTIKLSQIAPQWSFFLLKNIFWIRRKFCQNFGIKFNECHFLSKDNLMMKGEILTRNYQGLQFSLKMSNWLKSPGLRILRQKWANSLALDVSENKNLHNRLMLMNLLSFTNRLSSNCLTDHIVVINSAVTINIRGG